MMKKRSILFAGDPHGNFAPVIDAVKKHQPKAVVLLGDYDLKKPLEEYLSSILSETKIWWVPGNHDFEPPEHYHNLFSSSLSGQSIHLKVVTIDGLRIAGLGGIFLGRVWYPPNKPKWQSKQNFLTSLPAEIQSESLSLKYQSAIWPEEWAELKKLKADILVTHEAPRSHKYGFMVIDQLAAAMGVKQVFHGHLHEHYCATIRNGIKVIGVQDACVVDLAGEEI